MIIEGKKIAEEALAGLVQKDAGKLKLTAVLVGEHEGSKKFLELKEKAAFSIGVDYEIRRFSETITTEALIDKLSKIIPGDTNGVLIELPLPVHIDTQKVLDLIPPEKDIDVLSETAQGIFFAGKSKVLPPSVGALQLVFSKYGVDPAGKNCAIFGYGLLVGRQISHWLAQQKATVTIINESTSDAKYFSANADIIISGVGKPGLITADMVKEGAVVIDFGYENLNGKITGDVDEAVSSKAKLLAPVPGGMGPLVIVAVLKNLIILNA